MKRISAFLVSQAFALSCICPLATSAELFCDANGDGVVNAADATCILQYSAYVGAGGELSFSAYMSYDLKGEVPPIKEDAGQQEQPTVSISTSKEYANAIGEKVAISDIMQMAAEYIGAVDGTSFKYEGNKFEIYLLEPGDSRLQEAETGEIVLNISGFGEYKTNAIANGNFIMIYSVESQVLTDAFKSFKI